MVPTLKIGRHEVPFPLIQGGMGVRVSGASLAGHVARCGGIGLVASAGIGLGSRFFEGNNYFVAEPLAMKEEIRKAYEIAPDGVIGVNCMVAASDYDVLVRSACEAGAKLIVSGAGLPLNLPGLTEDFPEVALVPIVSSVKAAELICRKWQRGFNRLPDAIVVEDPETAGGHLGARPEDIGAGTYDQMATVRGVKRMLTEKFALDIPVITAGGIWDRSDLLQALEAGADGVQMGTRFVTTEECDASPAFKQAYIDCRPEDIGLIMSPAGLPGRALKANVPALEERERRLGTSCPMGCLRKCSYQASRERFCIISALDRAQRGDTETGLVFCGSNAWRASRIETVQEIFNDLFALQSEEVVNQ
ncbi:NAD(P)H-dependent flavin oxidoreductase YrpB (nitropropane dioxygenase family) [Geothermobacter ehrlichii]|uniref:NAD(P)H-dependent flavin oxidoreductase YrpB (Nitropropane dioxygenase family) n=1 Tax=Geothermobacter ehrlichii TaxID=213224 RepID=A0A5D3WJ95_9BACT|nr:NAD(P)H-dependent flavin oxidoreductase YrpB (nitropropane dioxygenase family) [Geothermobacter ehrlichii]